jgi:LPS-assembly lipoprotein
MANFNTGDDCLLQGRRLVLFVVAAMLGGCGFQPVYMPTASGYAGPAVRELAAIRVNPIPDRPGQLLRQALQERLGSDAGHVPTQYDLAVSFWVSGEGIAVQPDNTSSRVRLTASANWTLIAQDPRRTQVTNGSARAIDAFNILDQQYFAADLSNEATQRRLASSIADEIALQLAMYFRRTAAAAADHPA